MARAKSDLGYVHLNHALTIIRPAPFVETATARPLVGVQYLFDLADRFFGKMIELEKDGAVTALKLAIEFEHHLAAPVITFDEAGCLSHWRYSRRAAR